MTFTFDDEELELVQNGIAEQLARLMLHTPTDMHQSDRWQSQFDSLVKLGGKLGMEL